MLLFDMAPSGEILIVGGIILIVVVILLLAAIALTGYLLVRWMRKKEK